MTFAQFTGKLTGTAVAKAIAVNRLINWRDVAEIVIHGLKVLITLTILAGQYTRKAWDSLPSFSENLGQIWAGILYGDNPLERLDSVGQVPYTFAEQMAARFGLYLEFADSYGPAADWNDPEYGRLGVDLGEFNVWIEKNLGW